MPWRNRGNFLDYAIEEVGYFSRLCHRGKGGNFLDYAREEFGYSSSLCHGGTGVIF